MVGQLVLHVISVGVLAALVASACRLGRFRPAVCHALWLVVLIKLMVPPVVQWPWCLGDRAATWRATGSTAIQTAGDPVGTSISGEAALPA
jgi:hypothetical protein